MTTRTNRSHLIGLAACFVLAGVAVTIFSLTGCGTFFINGDNGTTGSTSSTGTTGTTGSLYSSDYVYVSDPTTNDEQISAYTVASGALTALASSPLTLGFSPVSMAVTPNDSLLFAAGATNLYAYTISTSGSLSLLQGGPVIANEDFTSIAITPDGNELFAVDPIGELQQYSINYTTGVLTSVAQYQLPASSGNVVVTPGQVHVCPSGECVVVALGTGGIEIYAFNESTDQITGNAVQEYTATTTEGDQDVGIDANNYIYVAQTNGLYVFSYNNSTGDVSSITSTPYTLGTGPYAVAVSKGSQYVYVANRGNTTVSGTVSEFSIGASGVLTSLGSAIAAPNYVSALSMDSTGQYLVALGYDSSNGVELYSLGATGALTSVAVAPSGNNTAAASLTIASVH